MQTGSEKLLASKKKEWGKIQLPFKRPRKGKKKKKILLLEKKICFWQLYLRLSNLEVKHGKML